jgi:hypothetical protein
MLRFLVDLCLRLGRLSKVGAELWRDRTADQRVSQLPLLGRLDDFEETNCTCFPNRNRHAIAIKNAVGGDRRNAGSWRQNTHQIERISSAN